jgi:hypothetical protein
MQLIIIVLSAILAGVLVYISIEAFQRATKPKSKEYLYITKRHLDGDVLPSPDAKIIFQDKSQTKVYFSVYPN